MFLFTFLLSMASYAYIPEYSLIASHAADQHGKGAYQVEQDVIFRLGSDALTVKETWIVDGEGKLRLTLEGRGPLHGMVQGTILYEGGQKFFMDPTTKVQRLGEGWLEPLFYFRSSKYFRNRLVTLKVAPPESLRERPPLESEGDIKYEPQRFVRLSRVGGALTWAIGAPPSTATTPTVWLEQDQFLLRKYRGADQSVLRAGDYVKYDDSFWFPRQRVYTFGNFTVEVQTLRVKSLGKFKNGEKIFKTSSLSTKDQIKLPDSEGLKDFYLRFR